MTFFASPNPSTADVNAVATQFATSKYDIRTLMRAIFRSSAFTAPSNYRSLLRSPTEYMVAAMRALNRPQLVPLAVRAAAGMDQVLYDPPNVAGWPHQRRVGLLVVDARAASTSPTVATTRPAALPDPTAAVPPSSTACSARTRRRSCNAAHTDADRWFALLAGPEFHLK